jgi:hypothetical protein
MKNVIVVIFCSIILLNCKSRENYADEIYQPEVFQRSIDSTWPERIKIRLKMFEEPDLSTLDHESYRLVFDHVFSDTTNFIRVGNKDSKPYFIHKKTIRNSDTTAIIVGLVEKPLGEDEWRLFKESIYQNRYWLLQREIDRMGVDGGTWTIEGRRPDAESFKKRSYHVVSRWSPEEGAFRNICKHLLEMDKKLNHGSN